MQLSKYSEFESKMISLYIWGCVGGAGNQDRLKADWLRILHSSARRQRRFEPPLSRNFLSSLLPPWPQQQCTNSKAKVSLSKVNMRKWNAASYIMPFNLILQSYAWDVTMLVTVTIVQAKFPGVNLSNFGESLIIRTCNNSRLKAQQCLRWSFASSPSARWRRWGCCTISRWCLGRRACQDWLVLHYLLLCKA